MSDGRWGIVCVLLAAALWTPVAPAAAPPHHHGSTGLGSLDPRAVEVVPPGTPGPVGGSTQEARAFRPNAGAAPGRGSGEVRLYRTGTNAIEPTLGIDGRGRVFFIGVDGAQWPAFPTQTVVTSDAGRTWDDVTPPPPQDHVTTEDPYLYVDEATGRVFSTDFMLPCTAVSRTDDAGGTWETSITACDLVDHQTIFAGPPVTSRPEGYPNVVYYCAVDAGAATVAMAVSCLKSVDGGATFVRTGEPAFLGAPDAGQAGACPGGSGHGVAGPDGTIYVPRGVCSEPWLAISHDEGATWEQVRVAPAAMGADGRVDHDAAVAVDAAGNLYYSWTGADLKPYLSVSKDGGATWTKPVMVAPPGVKIATLIALDVASPGNLAVAFVGSERQKVFGEGDYNGYLMVTRDGLSRDPLFHAARVNPREDPIDGTCATGSCGSNREFIDVAIAPDGTAWAAFSDGCYDGGCGHSARPFVGIAVGRGVVARLVGGPRLD